MTSRFVRLAPFAISLFSLAVACGGTGGGADDGSGDGGVQEGGLQPDSGSETDAGSVNGGASFAISGTLSGLGAGQSITITDNASDPLTLKADGAFTFAKKVQYGKSYSVTITATPENQDCSVQNAAGTVTGAVTKVAVTCAVIAPKMFLLAGKPGSTGTSDGTGPTARFNHPKALTVDAAGNVYVADTGNNAIRKITPAGVVTTFAGVAGGYGSSDGTGPAAGFNQPAGIAVDGTGTVFVADSGNYTIRSITTAGAVTTIAGTALQTGFVNGSGAGVKFLNPLGLFVKDGFLYIADRDNAAIRQLTIGGATPPVVTYQGGITTPVGIAYDATNGKFAEVSDYGQIVFEIGGTTLAGTGTTPGYQNGTGTAAKFHDPSAIAYFNGTMYVADPTNNVIRAINVTSGVVSTFAGTGAAGVLDGPNGQAQFSGPKGVAVDAAGAVYVADTGNSLIRKISGGMVTTLAGAPVATGTTDGTGTAARFTAPLGVASDSGGNVFVADSVNHTIRKIAPTGATTTFAGTVGIPGNTNANGIAASFNTPVAVAIDSADNVYVSDQGNCLIRKITKGGDVSTIADGGGCPSVPADRFIKFQPQGIAVNSKGEVFFVDIFSEAYAVWKIPAGGGATPFVGGTGGVNDGTGIGAWFNFPTHIAVDPTNDTMYVTDTGNSRVRQVTPAGVVTSVPFVTTPQLASPTAIVVDKAGTVYVADFDTGLVHKRTTAGVVTTVLGVPGQHGLKVDGPPGNLNTPAGLAIFGTNLFVSDKAENVIVHVTNFTY